MGKKRRKRSSGSFWKAVGDRLVALLRLIFHVVLSPRRTSPPGPVATSKQSHHVRLSRKLQGFHVVIDTNVLWGFRGVALTRRIMSGGPHPEGASAHILASQWNEISRGAKSKDAQRSSGFAQVRQRIHLLRKQGLIVHFSGIVSKATPNHADDEIVAVARHWLAEGRRVAVLTKDKELAQRLRRTGAGVEHSRFIVVSDAWIQQLLN